MATLSVRTLADPIWQLWLPENDPPELAVFRYQLADVDQVWLSQWLTEAEQTRANRFVQQIDKQRLMAGRSWTRWLIGQLTGVSPAAVQLETGTHGKPELVDADGWHVNIAHAGEWVLIALAKQPVGVDIEQIKPDFDYQELIPTCFGPAEQWALALARQQSHEAARRLFYTLWTRKEAILKATGIGMTDQLTAMSVLGGEQSASDLAIGVGGTWQIQSFAVADAYPAALAFEKPAQNQWFTLSLPLPNS